MLNKVISSLIFLLVISFNLAAYSYPKPNTYTNNECFRCNHFDIPAGYYAYANLGKNKLHLENKFIDTKMFRISNQNINSKYDLFLVHENNNLNLLAIYFLDNNIVVGYVLFEKYNASHPTIDIEKKLLAPIISLQNNSTYLENIINNLNGRVITIYEKSNLDYTERYLICDYKNFNINNYKKPLDDNIKILLLESFYPNSIETYIKPYILKNIQDYVDTVNTILSK